MERPYFPKKLSLPSGDQWQVVNKYCTIYLIEYQLTQQAIQINLHKACVTDLSAYT